MRVRPLLLVALARAPPLATRQRAIVMNTEILISQAIVLFL